MYIILPNSLSRLFVEMEFKLFDLIGLFLVLDPLIITFIQVALVLGPLSLLGVLLLLRKIEKDHPERIRWW